MATAVLSEGGWTADDVATRIGRVLGLRRRIWVERLSAGIVERHPQPPRPLLRVLVTEIESHSGFRRAHGRRRARGGFDLDPLRLSEPAFAPTTAIRQVAELPVLRTVDELAAWAGLRRNELEWYCDPQGRERRRPNERLRHYRYRWIAGSRPRLIEAPKSRLRELQRLVLDEVLARIPPHDAACGFRRGRSVRDFVAPHVGSSTALRMDLRHFFPSIPASRVSSLFRTIGYPEEVARRLTGLCTNSVPARVLANRPRAGEQDAWLLRKRLEEAHLPQGAPTSPAIANLCAHRLDQRLRGLSERFEAEYTRYADDLLFSGGPTFSRAVPRFRIWVDTIAILEGFAVNQRKSRVMPRGGRQMAAGVVFNTRPNVERREYDRLRAILHNCVRSGPHSQNLRAHPQFREHLLGRIAHIAILHPERGRRLRTTFNSIDWGTPGAP